MNRIKVNYHIDINELKGPNCDNEALSSPVDQSVIGSVFIVDPTTGHLKDCLSQVVSDPNNPRNPALMQFLKPIGSDKNYHLSDDDMISMLRSKYCQTPSELKRFSDYLGDWIRNNEPVVDKPAAVDTVSDTPTSSVSVDTVK